MQRFIAGFLALELAGCTASSAGHGTGVTQPAGPVSAVAQSVGKDPAALLARVSAVRYELYPGVFRGAAATLADGAGNDYDRALLMHDLLVAADSGATVRYAFCTLSTAQSDAAVAAARNAYHAPTIAANATALAAKAATPKLHDGFLRIAGFWKAAVAQERDQSAQLAADFQKAGAKLTAPNAGDLRSIAADHVWVQVQRQGNWLDIDPSSLNPQPGAALCAAAKTSDSLPDAAFDTVAVTLRLESRDGAQQSDATIASGTWRAADLANVPLTFAFAEPAGLRTPAPQPTGMRAYTPLLIAGTQTTAAAPITVLAPTKGPAVSTVTGGAVSQAAGAFGTAPPAVATAIPSPGGPIPVALRLDVAVTTPSAPGVPVERTIFDRVSAADRAAGRAATATLAPISLLPFGTALNVAVNLGTGVVGVGDRSALNPTSDDPAAFTRAMGVMHRAYYAMRRAMFADALAPSAPPVVAIRPGISFLGTAPQAAGVTPFGLTIDRASEGAVPNGGDAASGLAWAVASVYGERLAIATATMMSAADHLDQLPFDDSIEMFYIARHSNDAPAIVRSTTDVAALSASDDAKARLAASIAGGASAIVPSAQVAYGTARDDGWWILKPDGTVTDEMQSGMHQTTGAGYELRGLQVADLPGEAIELKEEVVEEAPTFRKTGFIIRCAGFAVGAVMAVASAIGPAEGSNEIAEMAAEQMNAIREANEAEEMREDALKCAE